MRLDRVAILLAALLLVACGPGPPATPPVDTFTSNDGTWILQVEPPLADCVLNEPCSFSVRVERSDAAPLPPRLRLEVDAAMPDHRHGLNSRPAVSRSGTETFQVDGLLLHMPGYWEVYFDVTTGAVTERAQLAVER